MILRWNGKHNGDLLLDYLHSLLSHAFPDTEFIKAYETDPALSGISKDLPESEATARALLELRPDLVIAATGDCGPVPHGSPSIRSSSNARASRP